LQRLPVVALAFADVAGYVDVGEKVHLDLDDTITLTRLASSTLDVEAEAAGIVASRPRFGDGCEELPNRRKKVGVRRRVGARRAADRRLVDVDHVFDVLEPLDPLAWCCIGCSQAAVDLGGRVTEERVDDQSGLPGAGDAGHTG